MWRKAINNSFHETSFLIQELVFLLLRKPQLFVCVSCVFIFKLLTTWEKAQSAGRMSQIQPNVGNRCSEPETAPTIRKTDIATETLNTDESRFLERVYRDFWILLPLGGFFGYFHTTAWKWFSLTNYCLLYIDVTISMSLFAYTMFLVSDNLVLFSMSAHIFIVGCVAVGASLPATYNRQGIIRAGALYANPYFAKYSHCEYFEELQKNTVKKKNFRIVTWLSLYGVCGVIGVCQPVIDRLFNRSLGITNFNGVWLNLPFAMWVPFDLEYCDLAYGFVFLVELITACYAVVMVTAGNVLAFMMLDHLLDQYKLLIYSIETLETRALAMFNLAFPKDTPHLKLEEFDELCCKCLAQSLEHHQLILKYLDSLMDVISVPVAIPFFGGAFLLGLAAITITADDDPRMGPKFLAAGLAFSEGLNMYQLCNVGQQFENLSNDFFNMMYSTRWYERSTKYRRILLISRYACFRPTTLLVGKLLVLNMKLFSDLVNSAYSIFNFKSASSK